MKITLLLPLLLPLRLAFWLLFLSPLLGPLAFANLPPGICERTHANVLAGLQDPTNQLGFRNDGGIANGGVCWWHARFIRNAAYLARFKPELPKANAEDARRIAHHLSHFQTVTIPGYRNLSEFSRDHVDVIQNSLEHWQKTDAFMKQAWTRGIRGKIYMPSGRLERHMDHILRYFKEVKRPVFLKLQMPGVTAHAFLMIGAVDHDHGFDLVVIDSNMPEKIRFVSYQTGTNALMYNNTPYIPYIEQEKDVSSIGAAYWNECGKELE